MEFEPIKKENHRSFLVKNIYILVLGIILLLGTSYSLDFLNPSNRTFNINMNVAGLDCEISDQNIDIVNMLPSTDNVGLISYEKSLTITNNSPLNGKIELNLIRLNGVLFNDLRYGLYINDILIKVDNVLEDGLLSNLDILGNETINIRLSLWLKEDYVGYINTFNGLIMPNIKLDTILATTYLSKWSNENRFILFNDRLWQVKDIKDNRLIIVGNNQLSEDNPLIFNYINETIFLKKTTKIISGNGTIDNPYILNMDSERIDDRKVIGHITYVDDLVPTNFIQPIYASYDNYISEYVNDPSFVGWSSVINGMVEYCLGDKIKENSDITLYAVKRIGW